ncbi:FecR domain-containing protein [Nitrosomonas sp.]|uniref:FecR domain-containing protein n=1 Tax=Nitrosomonas sp. TaxID=42353 RepID=UPI002636A280|nr:FecR domain-containing protein [Nitrosomonas sp.]
MDISKTQLIFQKLNDIYSEIYPLRVLFSLNLCGNKIWLLPLLLTILFLNGCKTVPIQDRNFSERGGFWEQDENTSFRFHHNAGADNAVIGSMYASGKSTLLNGAQVKISAKLKNNSLVSTGPQSSARIEFKASDSTCLIRVDEFNFGNAYADTSDCQQTIETMHATIQAKDAILHLNVSQHQTEVTVLSGVIKVTLRENTTQSINVRADREIIITHDAIGRSYPVTPDEIWQRIRWRDDFQLYKTVVDWETIIAGVVVGVVTIGIIAAVILLSKGHGGRGHGSGFPRHH